MTHEELVNLAYSLLEQLDRLVDIQQNITDNMKAQQSQLFDLDSRLLALEEVSNVHV